MHISEHALRIFFKQNEQVVKLELTKVDGSSPRNVGTVMYVACKVIYGTIGGGQLEFLAIENARKMLNTSTMTCDMDIPLGPEIGQCCGGRVTISLIQMSLQDKNNDCTKIIKTEASLPYVYILGGGHVGRSLANQFQHLPVRCILVDTRENELIQCNAKVETRLSAIPEMDIQTAPAGSVFIIVTHDHALDFLLTSTALVRKDAAYVGMIGSSTKRAKFKSWCRDNCTCLNTQDLNCPIGASSNIDKRPSVIAAFVVAEVLASLTSELRQTSSDAEGCKQAMGLSSYDDTVELCI